jgi:NitT/TauT family transport system permease protein
MTTTALLRHGARLAPPVAVGVLALATWSALGAADLGVPTPVGTCTTLVKGIAGGNLVQPAGETLEAFGIGYGLALLVGFTLGWALGASTLLRKSCEHVLAVVYAVPKVILFPLLLVLFGISLKANVALAFVASLFPIMYFTMDGVRVMPPVYGRLAQVMRATVGQRAVKFVLPAIMPGFLAGARIALSVALINVTIAELFAGHLGLGALMARDFYLGDLDELMAVGLLLFIVTGIGSVLLGAAGRLLGWSKRRPEIPMGM